MLVNRQVYIQENPAPLAATTPHIVHRVEHVQIKMLCTNPAALVITCQAIGSGIGARLIPYIYFKPPADGIYEFQLVADAPAHDAEAETILTAEYVWPNFPPALSGIRIVAQHNAMVAQLHPPVVKNVTANNLVTSGFPFHRFEWKPDSPMAVLAYAERAGHSISLHVHGLVRTGSSDDVVMVKSVRPHATQRAILELHLAVIESNGRIKNVCKPFSYQCQLTQACGHVHIHSPGLPVWHAAVQQESTRNEVK